MLKIFNYLVEIFNGSTGEESVLQGKGLKILTPNQMHSRLPIYLVKLDNYYILCADQKNLQRCL